jgi:serine/threonine-protein kinase
MQVPPEPSSRHSALPIPAELEEIVLSCLAKRPADRPVSARELADRLASCEVESRWSREDARRWWEMRSEGARTVAAVQLGSD